MHAVQQFSNGLTLVCQTRPGVSTSALELLWLAGSRFQGAGEEGVAHLLEHLLLAGRAEAMASLGGEINASTGQELISLRGLVSAGDTPALLKLFLEALQKPRFEQLEREQRVIALEQGMMGPSLEDIALANALGDHPLAQPVGQHSVTKLSTITVEAYWQRLLQGSRLWVSAVGPQTLDWWVAQLEPLGCLPKGTLPDPGPVPTFRPAQLRHGTGASGRVLWLMPASPASQGVDYPQLMLSQLLGGEGHSRLYQALREQRGLVYGIHHWLEQYRDAGFWGIDTICQPGRLNTVLAVADGEVQQLLQTPPVEAVLVGLRRGLEARLVLDEADPLSCAARLGRETLYLGHPLDLATHRAGLAAVDGMALQARLEAAWQQQLRLCL